MIILGTLVATCALLVVYPYVVYPQLLKLLPARPVVSGEPKVRSASLLFCAFNEGVALAEKLANIEVLKTRYPSLEVLAYNDALRAQVIAGQRRRLLDFGDARLRHDLNSLLTRVH